MKEVKNILFPYNTIRRLTAKKSLNLFWYTKKKYGTEARALFVAETPFSYFHEGHSETLMWYHYKTRVAIMDKPQNAEELYIAVFEVKKFDFIVMPLAESSQYKQFYAPEFMAKLEKEFSAAGYGVFSPKTNSGIVGSDSALGKGEQK